MSRRHGRDTSGLSAAVQKRRCAVYTRKSTEEGLEKEFNTLVAQGSDACAALRGQPTGGEGWVLLEDHYDDGGCSGGTLERAALRRLLADTEAERIDVVVVYKIDRLSRSLMDFAKLVEIFDRHDVTFVSVTQSFNTTTSMGRLTLNILLSFAQFEREVIGERIRDKFAASRARGMWMGGSVPLGYDVRDRKLVVNNVEAATIMRIFTGFVEIGSGTKLTNVLRSEGVTTKRGRAINKCDIYKILNNRTYVGEVTHKGNIFPGEQIAIVSHELWDRVHAILTESPRARANKNRSQSPALLRGLIFGADGRAMSPTHTRRRGRLYRYYVSQRVLKCGVGADDSIVRRVSAAEIESAVVNQIRAQLRQPEIIIGTWLAARVKMPDLTEDEARDALTQLDPLWEQLFPAEQARIVRLLVERVEIGPAGADIRLRLDGLVGLVADLSVMHPNAMQAAALSTATTITVRVALVIRHWRGHRTVVMPDGQGGTSTARTRSDPAMVKALARAFRWKRLLDMGRYASVSEIAAVEKIDRGYVGSILRLTLIAPDIVQTILDGRQPEHLSLPVLLKPFPLEWSRQRVIFGRPEVSSHGSAGAVSDAQTVIG